MTPLRQTVEDYVPLLDFLGDAIEKDEALPLASRIGLRAKVKTPEHSDARNLWQAVAEAVLAANRMDAFLREIGKLVGDGDREGFEQAQRSCAKSQFQAILARANPDLGSASGQLSAARTRGELADAGTACRDLVLRILSSVEVGSPHRPLMLIASTAADIDRVAERIGTLAMNVLTILDRMLDLTDPVEVAGVQLMTVGDGDEVMSLGIAEPDDAKTLTQARNVRAIAWTQLQRLLAELNRSSTL